jgi:hypothetical protein
MEVAVRTNSRETTTDRREALWPVSFEAHPSARPHAYALTVLVIVCVVAVTTDRFYWADSQWKREPTWFFLFFMTVPIALMAATLASAVTARVPRAVHHGVAALAWLTAVLAIPLELLMLMASSADLCETPPPSLRVYQNPGVSVPVLIVVSLGVGSLVGWAFAGRRLHPATRYAIWLGTAATVLAPLSAWALHNSPTCSPLIGG